MLNTNTNFDTEHAKDVKRPIYIITFEGYSDPFVNEPPFVDPFTNVTNNTYWQPRHADAGSWDSSNNEWDSEQDGETSPTMQNVALEPNGTWDEGNRYSNLKIEFTWTDTPQDMDILVVYMNWYQDWHYNVDTGDTLSLAQVAQNSDFRQLNFQQSNNTTDRFSVQYIGLELSS